RLDAFLELCEAEWAEKTDGGIAELRRLETDLREAQAAIARWDRAYETGRLGLEEFLSRVEPHRERMGIIRNQLAAEVPAPVSRGRLTTEAVHFGRVWNLATPQERKALLLRALPAFGARIQLHRGRTAKLVPAV
ncbi:MAG TPA: hypothetical protein VD973_11810, partial [Symbiobacteriaceae bacterium]|nr:hypothetical protein [Symbiobacteriaceae bacterium]